MNRQIDWVCALTSINVFTINRNKSITVSGAFQFISLDIVQSIVLQFCVYCNVFEKTITVNYVKQNVPVLWLLCFLLVPWGYNRILAHSNKLTISTLPTMEGPWCSFSGWLCLRELRYKHIPVRKSLGWPTSIQKPATQHQTSDMFTLTTNRKKTGRTIHNNDAYIEFMLARQIYTQTLFISATKPLHFSRLSEVLNGKRSRKLCSHKVPLYTEEINL